VTVVATSDRARRSRCAAVVAITALAALLAPSAFAADASAATGLTFLWIGLLLLAAKIASLVERIGQPAVLGELLVGVLIGNAYLFGIPGSERIVDEIAGSEILKFLAELGVVILLFQIGLESNVASMRKVGVPALLVATIGVVAPMLLGTYVLGPWLLPDLSFNGHLFLGATLTATSVGITGRVFQDLKVLQSREAQIVLGAAVIDDVMGLVILAVVSAVVISGSVDALSVAWIAAKAALFLAGALFLGHFAAHRFSRLFCAIHAGAAMKVAVLISTCLTFAWAASLIGLAPIVGAFAAGLVLDEVQFKGFAEPALARDMRSAAAALGATAQRRLEAVIEQHSRHGLVELVAPVGHMLVPMFFIYTGMQVKLETMMDGHILFVAAAVTVVAFLGKLVSGIAAGDVRKWVVGWGMAPRGEVGLIFAATGKALGVIPDQVFSMVIVVVMLTTLLTPPVLVAVIRRRGVTAQDESAPGLSLGAASADPVPSGPDGRA
jgi:Kef-type K+ transport system membrane component KefB